MLVHQIRPICAEADFFSDFCLKGSSYIQSLTARLRSKNAIYASVEFGLFLKVGVTFKKRAKS
jgi:hypothetical protein